MEVKNRVQIVVTGITGFITLESAYQRNVRQSSAPELERVAVQRHSPPSVCNSIACLPALFLTDLFELLIRFRQDDPRSELFSN